MEITTLGIDLAKSVFQLHGVDDRWGCGLAEEAASRGGARLSRQGLEPCLIGMEACPTSHFWAREIAALGHDVRLIPPAYVKPYVKRQKNDAADAEASLRGGDTAKHALCSCEDRGAAGRPRPAPVARLADEAENHDPQRDPSSVSQSSVTITASGVHGKVNRSRTTVGRSA